MNRVESWSQKLTAYVNQTRDMKYAIGTNDCVHWCARAIEVMTGENLLDTDPSFFDYTDEATMQATIKRLGGLLRAVETYLEQPARGGNNARRGDLVYFHPQPSLEAVGICLGTQFVLPGNNGLEFVPMRLAEASWRIA